MTVGQSSLISLAHHCYDWHPGSCCICNCLTSKVDGGITGSWLRWSILTYSVTPQSGNQVSTSLGSTSLGNSGLCWTVFARNRDTAVPAAGNGDLQTLIRVSLWRDQDDVSHCRIMSPDKTEWRLISATLCGWRHCFVADQLWLMKCTREEEEDLTTSLMCSFTLYRVRISEQLNIRPSSLTL